MNSIYKVIWSKTSQAWIVVGEIAKSHGRQKSKKIKQAVSTAIAALAIGSSAIVNAGVTNTDIDNPLGTTINNGEDSFSIRFTDGGSYTVNNQGTISFTLTYGNAISNENSSILTSLINSGTISASGTSESNYAAHSQGGIYNDATINTLINSGTIDISAIFSGSGSMYGIQNDGTISSLTNSGRILVNSHDGSSGTTLNISGIWNEGTITSLTNSGTISASNTTTDTVYSEYGIYNYGGQIGTLINSGTISVTGAASQSQAGIYNTGTIGTLTNTGTISVNIPDGSTGRWVYGIYSQDTIDTLTNTGSISVAGNGRDLAGVYLYGLSDVGDFTNSGSISVSGNALISVTGLYNEGDNNSFNNSGTINASGTAHSIHGIYNTGTGTITTLTNSGTIKASGTASSSTINGILNEGTITSLTNSGTIWATGTAGTDTNNGLIYGLSNGGDITTLNNSGTIKASGNAMSNWGIYNVGTITTLLNSGMISGKSTAANWYSGGIWNNGGTITSIDNSGTIRGLGSASTITGIYTTGEIGTLTNSGTISATFSSTNPTRSATAIVGIFSRNDIGTLTNSGTISASGKATANGYIAGIETDGGDYGTLTNTGTISVSGTAKSYTGIFNDATATIDTLINSGTISVSGVGGTVINGINNRGVITTLTNTGTINTSGTATNIFDIYNSGTITTLNNSQAGLTYSGQLPDTYKSIISSTSNYGQLNVNSADAFAPGGAAAMTYGVYSGSSGIGVRLQAGTYSNVITGVENSLIDNAGSAITLTGDGTNSVGSATATLTETSSDNYDLVVTGNYTYFNQANTQTAVNNTAKQIGGVLGAIGTNMNFAHMTTYDCQVYGSQGGCLSAGGRYIDTSSPNGYSSGAVMVGGYKINDQLRIGGFVDQSFNAHTQDIDLSNGTPMLGMNLVWNQTPQKLGYQMKLGNTFQNLDAKIHRATVGASENASGSTDINTQSYHVELSYRHMLPSQKTILEPLIAARYNKTKVDGYTEKNAGAPIRYNAMKDESTTLMVGLKSYHQITPKLNMNVNLGYEKDINLNRDRISGQISGVSSTFSSALADSVDKTRFFGSLGARYQITNNQQLEATAYLQQARYNHGEARVLYLNYSVGF